MKTSSKQVFIICTVIGAVCATQLPDGNLLVTNVIAFSSGAAGIGIWKIFNKLSGL